MDNKSAVTIAVFALLGTAIGFASDYAYSKTPKEPREPRVLLPQDNEPNNNPYQNMVIKGGKTRRKKHK